ncbi:hypothetical protein HY493_05230 [Candidatus Woesearchaeota archaeon]|nr:hypothetical protein [Candidatus Woesearchaeota archaeon]
MAWTGLARICAYKGILRATLQRFGGFIPVENNAYVSVTRKGEEVIVVLAQDMREAPGLLALHVVGSSQGLNARTIDAFLEQTGIEATDDLTGNKLGDVTARYARDFEQGYLESCRS